MTLFKAIQRYIEALNNPKLERPVSHFMLPDDDEYEDMLIRPSRRRK